MNSTADDQAHITAAQRSARAAAIEPTVLTPEARPTESGVPAGPSGPHTHPAAFDDRERREREREGGGATENDRYGEHPSMTDRLQRVLVRLIERFIRALRTPKAAWQKT